MANSTVIQKGRDMLLSLGRVFAGLRNTIYRQYILRLLIHGDLELEELKSKLSREYGISLSNFVLNQLLRELGREGYIHGIGLYLRIRETGIQLIKEVERRHWEKSEDLAKLVMSWIPKEFENDLHSKRREIIGDIIRGFGEVIDRYFYELCDSRDLSSAVESLVGTKPEFKCKVRSISDTLRTHLERAYQGIWELRRSKDSRTQKIWKSLVNTSFFWSAFVRLSSYSDEARAELLAVLRATRILLDTNTMIALGCSRHPLHRQAMDYVSFLNRTLRIELYYMAQTQRELDEHLARVQAAVRFLQNFPEKARTVAFRTEDPILQEFFRDRYVDWESYFDGFMRNMRRCFTFIDEGSLGVKAEEVQGLVEKSELVAKVSKLMGKPEAVAAHDAYLIALVKKMRESHVQWFKLVDWILTIDLKVFLYDRYLWEKAEPTSIFLTRVPYYFYAFGIADAIQKATREEAVLEMSSLYDVIVDATMAIEERRETLHTEVSSLAGVKQLSDLEEKLLMTANDLLRTGGDIIR